MRDAIDPSGFVPPEDFVAAIFGYFDESGKFKDTSVTSFCGVIASFSKIEDFGSDWNYRLRRAGLPRGLSMKHALKHKLALSQRMPAKGVKNRISALMDFADCIKSHLELVVGYAVDVGAFNALNSEVKRLLGKDPHFIAFERAVHAMVKYIPNGATGSLVCDDEEAFAIKCYQMYGRMKRSEGIVRKKLVSISFADDGAYPALQAADMTASLTRLEAQRKFLGHPYEYQSLFNHLASYNSALVFNGGFFDKTALQKLAAGVSQAQKRAKGKVEPLA